MGMIAYWKRETAMAEDYLDRALRGDPGARDALVFKADLRYAAGDITGAVMLLRDAKRLRKPSLPEVADAEIGDRLLRYEAALQPLRKARGGVPDMPGWVLCVIGVTLALTFLAAAGLPGAWNGTRHYQDGKARLVSLDYSGCASEMEMAVEAAPTSPKAWAYEAYCYFLDKDNKAGLSAWYTALSYEPAITLDTKAEQQVLLARIRLATAKPTAPQ
jgi:tetratricopeptide (TPR) repeat protein